MKNSDYWKKRFVQLEKAQHSMGADAMKEIEELYRKAQAELDGKILAWYQRFADNNQITLAEARKWLNASQLAELKWDVNQYIKYGQDNALMGGWMKELENASAKYHISKFEALKIQTQQSLESLFAKQFGIIGKTMGDVYESGYYHTAFEFQKGFRVGWDIAGLDQSQIEKIISKPWAADGKNFSERIWQNKQKLINEVHSQLTRGVMLGHDPQKEIDVIARKMQTSKTNAGRLVMTEEAFFSSAAQKDCFERLGVEQYEIVATLDSHTSDICRSLDGQHFPMKDFQPGVTAPPFHVWCRSTTAPYFEDDFGEVGERVARDEATGKRYYIPDDMNYQEWHNTFVEDGDKSGFDVIDEDGVVHYVKHKEPEPPKPKKTYLTKKKLQANIANADVQIEDLENEFKALSGGWTYDDIIKDFGSLEDFADGEDLEKLKANVVQIEQISAQKEEWQKKLDEKLMKEKKKELLKKKSELQKQLDETEIKTYSGIWKDDVTTADWSKLNIAGKKKYYEGKFITETDTDKMKEFQELYKQLEELDVEGKAFNDIEKELKKVEFDLTNLGKDVKIMTYPQDRRDAAKWFTPSNGGFSKADAYFDPLAKKIHGAATKAEHKGFYTYTQGSGGHNRPLAGFEKPWSESGTGWEERFYKGAKNVWIDFEGKGKEIRALTELIEKSTYPDDVWLQSGQEFQTLEGFLHIPYGTISKMTDAELQQFIGTKDRMYPFISTAVNEGGGSCFNSKPMKLNIFCPKGSEMLYASDVGAFGKGENEMILQRGGSYRITNIYWGNDATDGNKRKLFVDMEIHIEDGYDKFQQDASEWTGSKKNYHD